MRLAQRGRPDRPERPAAARHRRPRRPCRRPRSRPTFPRQFSGGRPAVTAERVTAVYADPKGTKIPLPGHSFLHVVFRWASGFCPQPAHRTWTGPNVLTPRYPQLLAVAAAATRGLPELRPRPVRPGAVSHLHADRPGPDSDRRQPRRVQVISAESARGHQTA